MIIDEKIKAEIEAHNKEVAELKSRIEALYPVRKTIRKPVNTLFKKNRCPYDGTKLKFTFLREGEEYFSDYYEYWKCDKCDYEYGAIYSNWAYSFG
jgi:hypothetical protein